MPAEVKASKADMFCVAEANTSGGIQVLTTCFVRNNFPCVQKNKAKISQSVYLLHTREQLFPPQKRTLWSPKAVTFNLHFRIG